MDPEKQENGTSGSGQRLEIAVKLAEASMRDGPACPPQALTKPASANVQASDAGWVEERNKHWLQVMAEHTVTRNWSYVIEVEEGMP